MLMSSSHGDHHLADTIAVVQDRLHHLPRLFIVTFLETDGDVRTEIDQRFDQMNIVTLSKPFLIK